jgi:hypothetical protein
VGRASRAPEIRRFLADAVQQARLGLASTLANIASAAEPAKAQAVGGFYQAMLSGLLVQWLTDPDRAPTGRDLGDALRAITSAGPVVGDGAPHPGGAAPDRPATRR